MSAEITTNRTVSFPLGGLHSNVSTNGLIIKLEDLVKVSQLLRESSKEE